MNTLSVPLFDLKTAWPSHRCTTIQDYLKLADGKRDLAGHPHAFRGVGRQFCNLRATFDRHKMPDTNPVEIETRLIEEFLLCAWNDLKPQERYRFLRSKARWGKTRNTAALVVARHRGVPTRCVDWSHCPLVALFFACERDSECDGEVWWFDLTEFERFVEVQWPALFAKHGHVEAVIEQDFIAGVEARWLTALHYELLPDDRPERQRAWITVTGRLGTCHAEEIHLLDVCRKGRLVIPAELKPEAIQLLEQLGITKQSLGFCGGDPADKIATRIREKFENDFPIKTCPTLC